MTGWKFWLCVVLVLGIACTSIIIAHAVNETNGNSFAIDENTKYIIFDTDMGADDA